MKAPTLRKAKKLEKFKKWLQKNEAQFDKDGDGVPDWLPASLSANWQQDWAGLRSLRKTGVMVATKLPENLTSTELERTTLDLSATKLRLFGKRKDPLTIEIAASEGVLEAMSNNKVSVTGSGTGTLQLTGKFKDLKAFLKNKKAFTYNIAQDDDNAASLALSAIINGTSSTLGTSNISISDAPDSLIQAQKNAAGVTDPGSVQQPVAAADPGVSIRGNGRSEVLDGGSGNDTIDGRNGNDFINGGAGDDSLIGGRGNDTINGQDGNDTLDGGDGNDSHSGGDGNDLILGSFGDDTFDGGDGIDTIDFSYTPYGVNMDLDTETLVFFQGGHTETIANFENAIGGSGDDSITGTTGNNLLNGGDGNDTLNGGDGDDTLAGGDGDDSQNGGDGNDLILGSFGDDTFDGGDGIDTIDFSYTPYGVNMNLATQTLVFFQGGHTETIANFENAVGGSGDDSITGTSGDNVLDGGAGNDTLNGGAGDDLYRFNAGDGADTVDDFEIGADQIEIDGTILDPTAVPSGISVVQQGSDVLITYAGGETVTLSNVSLSDWLASFATEIVGTSGNDTLNGDGGRNIIRGLGANDYLLGHAGDDSIIGEAGNDTIIGGAGADTLEGGANDDVLQYLGSPAGVNVDLNADGSGFQQASGGDADGDVISGFEHVYATDHADVLIGDAGRNILFGYDGDDSIAGNDGDDVLRGGEGADTLEGGDGVDWVRYLDAASGVTVDLNADGSGFQQASRGEAQGDVLSGFENVYGSNFDDVITGDAGGNYILGYDGNDSIDAGDGRDTVRGGEGADTLDGGDDTDLLQYIDSDAGVTINLTADGSGFQQASGGYAQGDVISGFENVYGSNFNDVISGDDGRNIIYGYDGDDTIDGGDGKDAFRGGNGADTFIFSTALSAGNVDRILDFSAPNDIIGLDSGIFTGLAAGALAANQFLSNDTGLAATADQRIIFENDTGHLYFDSDGNGAAEGEVFATLTSIPSVDETDFFIF